MYQCSQLSLLSPFKYIFLVIPGVSLAFGCGSVTGQPGIGQDGANSGGGSSYSLSGAWVGLYKAKQSETSGVRETKATVTIESTGNLIGNFKLELPAYDSANVAGNYRDFAGKSLMIDITSSNFSALGLTGSRTDLPYDLVGDALEFSNERFSLKLTKQGKSQENADPQGAAVTSSSPSGDLIGRWTCQDSSRFAWKLDIKSSTTFAADVIDTAGSQASVWMDGSVTISPNGNLSTATLRVEASDVNKYLGKSLIIAQKDKDNATLSRPDERTASLACTRQTVR